ncbi:MAG: arylesterase [Betaproteobacteria bacterium]|nr:arylesterase [Betaproteobacteria bacterium]
MGVIDDGQCSISRRHAFEQVVDFNHGGVLKLFWSGVCRIVRQVRAFAGAQCDGARKKQDGAQPGIDPRRRAWFPPGIVLAFLLGAASPAQANKPTVLIFGDSLSAAYGLDSRQGWPALLATALEKKGVALVNASISGETTQGGRARLAAELVRHKPKVVVIALGGNDGLRGWPVAETRKNLEAMTREAKAAKATVVLAGMQIPPNYGLDYARDFRDQYAGIAKREKLILIPFLLEGIADRLELFQGDKIHPTAAAQPMIVKLVQPAVERALATMPMARGKS